MQDKRECVSVAGECATYHASRATAGLCLAILALVQGCSSSGKTVAQNAIGAAEGRTTSGTPYLVVDKTVYDLGDIKPNSIHVAVFHLRNGGAGILRIADVQKCCGATVELEKHELAPSEEGVLRAKFHVAQGSDVFTRRIAVVTNDPEIPQTELTIRGKVIQTLAWTPARFEIPAFKDNVTCPEITIRSLEKVPFSIKGFKATGQCLTGDFDPNRKATEFTLSPKVDVAKVNALTTPNGNIRIELDHPDHRAINVGFSVIPALRMTPPQILVFNAKASELVVRSLHVEDNEADPNSEAVIAVESVACKNGSRAELRGITSSKTGCEFKLELWPAGAKDKESFSTDELVIRLEDGRELTVPLRVFYQSSATSSTANPVSNM